MAISPKALILDCTTTLASAITEFCSPEGRPYCRISRVISPSKRTSRHLTWYSLGMPISRRRHSATLTNCERMVASAAPSTPMPRPAISRISNATLVTEEVTR